MNVPNKLKIYSLAALAFFSSCGQKQNDTTSSVNDTPALADSIAGRYTNDSIAYAQLNVYDGTYDIQTESEGVNAHLELKYNGDKTFNYKWSFEVSMDEVNCNGKIEGVLAMDRTQHGFYESDGCMLHFNFNQDEATGYAVELEFADQDACKDLTGECIFTGTYKKK